MFDFPIDDLGPLPRPRSWGNSKQMGTTTPEDSRALTEGFAQIGNVFENFGGDDQVEGIILEVEGADVFADGPVSHFLQTAFFVKCSGVTVRGRQHGSQRGVRIEFQYVHFRESLSIATPYLSGQEFVTLIRGTK